MKGLKYFWPGIGSLKVSFPKRYQGFRAVVQFDPDIEALLRKEQSMPVSREGISVDHQHIGGRKTPPRGGK